jgi:hypothetical protein
MNVSKKFKLTSRRRRLRDIQSRQQVYQLRCPECGRWPWQMRLVESSESDCSSCVELRRTNPDPFEGRRIPVMVIDPNGMLD